MNKAPKDNAVESTVPIEAMGQIIDSPLFTQIAAMMVACKSAKIYLDEVQRFAAAGAVQSEAQAKKFGELMGILLDNLNVIDFEHGDEIVTGALDACRMVQPNVDIICSGFLVGMPQKSKNPEKKMFIKGGIANGKAAIMWLDKDAAEKMVQLINDTLDILHPGRITGVKKPNLILPGTH